MTIIRPFYPQDDNHYQINDIPWNDLIDHIMPTLKPNSWKVLCFILRKTLGWNKDADKLSYTQIRNGITNKSASDTTIKNALLELTEAGYILADAKAEKSAPMYGPNKDYVFQTTIKTVVDEGQSNTTETIVDEKSTTEMIEPKEETTIKTVVDEGQSTTKTVDTKVVVLLQENPDELFAEIYRRWSDAFDKEMTQTEITLLGDYIDDPECDNEWVWKASQIVLTQKPEKPWPYMKKILDAWIQNNGPPPIEMSNGKHGARRKTTSNKLPANVDPAKLNALEGLT